MLFNELNGTKINFAFLIARLKPNFLVGTALIVSKIGVNRLTFKFRRHIVKHTKMSNDSKKMISVCVRII